MARRTNIKAAAQESVPLYEQAGALSAENCSSPHQLGARLRRFRQIKRLTLESVATQAGCTVGMLSKVERGLASPSLQLLLQLCTALQCSFASVFDNEEPALVVVQREGERARVQLDSGTKSAAPTFLEQLVPAGAGRSFNANLYTIPPGGGSQGVLSHEGEEVGYVINGLVELTVAGQVYVLKAGASFYFPSHLPHSYRNVGEKEAHILWVGAG